MQPQNRKYIILGGAGLVVLLLVFLTFTLRGGGSTGSSQSVCEDFIDAVIAQDVEKSYALFSPGPRTSMTQGQWKDVMIGMQSAHYKATYELAGTNDLTSGKTDKNPDPGKRLQLNYIVKSPPFEVDVSCYALQTDDGIKVDAYTMSPRSSQGTNTNE